MARWWPFGSRDTTPTPAHGPSASSPVEASARAPQQQGDRPGTAWRALPALQRTIGSLQPVASTAAFEAGLTSHHSPAFLAPLGHLVDARGPSGEVGGLLRTAVLPPVQRVALASGYPAPGLEFVVPARKLPTSARIPEPSKLMTAGQPPVVARLAALDPLPLSLPVPEPESEPESTAHLPSPRSEAPYADAVSPGTEASPSDQLGSVADSAPSIPDVDLAGSDVRP